MEDANKIDAFANKKRRALLLNDTKTNPTTAQTPITKRLKQRKSMWCVSIEKQILFITIFHNRRIKINRSSNRINKYIKYNKNVK